ncbi:MAG: hypothetical protein M0R17_04620 [Candidatus Omnitrophica bacterium]|jgi:hypothetical protein|nr:hypothetical protein [Candidatus Omnitrophota bacterium]
MNGILQSYNGLIRFYDGTVIAIEDQEYSPDGIYNWEKTFNPNTHISTLDGVTTIQGHEFKRVKHSGDTSFQLPYRIVPDEPVFRVLNSILQYKLESQADSAYINLFDLSTLQGQDGAQGLQGIPGEGWHIDTVGYIATRPNCCGSASTSTCQSCNPGNSTNYQYSTFMSLGDGALILTSTLISAGTVTVNSVAYTYFSNDLITWTALTGGIIDFQARYLATNSTGAVYVDMRTQNYYSSRGVVYVCADGQWVVLTNVATPSYMVGETSGSTNIGYFDNFVDLGDFDTILQTITLDSGKLVLIQGSIDNTAFDTTVFGYGLDYALGSAVEVAPGDFNGFGIGTYIADSDSETKLQVLIDVLIGDGARIQTAVTVDNETRHLIGIDVNDLINNDSGLIATAQVDTFYDLSVNLGNGLILDGGTPQAITIDTDALSLIVDATSLRVKPYASGNDGIMKTHLNPDIIWANHGVGFDQLNGIYARIDGATIGYTGSGLLEVPINGITGDRLNDNVADETAGIEILNDLLTIKVDGTTIDFNGSGELTYIGLAGQVVSSITAGGATMRDNIAITFGSTTGSIDITPVGTVNAGTDTLAVNIVVDEAWLAGYLLANPSVSSATWGTITGTITAQTDLVSYITGRLTNYTILNTWYDDIQINSTHGLILRSVGGNTFKVIVDDQGNLDTQVVTL